ncbi:MAG: SGNH/GDSL hydrolase family protein [Candidatus Hydrogenedentes bacterium]|nr:SGNH/GDSL hydrolase family protein [Candidatus Hydrogenedentota bacterium]
MNRVAVITVLTLGVMMRMVYADEASSQPGAGKDMLEKARRILFLGDSITYDGRYVADFDAWLTTKFPDRTYEVLDLGISSEMVSGLSEEGHADGRFPRPDLAERLVRVLDATKPDLVIACYGMNCGIYQPFDPLRFAKYQAGILWMHEMVTSAGAPIVHITPPAYDHLTGEGAAPDYNDVLGKYSDWILSKRADGWNVVDLHGPMNGEIAKRRTENPNFSFQPDGIHPDDAGHWFMAQQLIRFFGDTDAADATDPAAMLTNRPGGPAVLGPVRERMAVLRDAWLTLTKHSHPDLPKGLPMDEAQAKADALTKNIKQLMSGKG